uniref:Uncharacterized protein n=1 Tax=Vibrio cholerae serotype O1 biovar El Tor TaxID=686 RepID=M1RZD7_VIBCE|nr:hypothetical protein [Vibrio cholerae O1 biovar El Tor]
MEGGSLHRGERGLSSLWREGKVYYGITLPSSWREGLLCVVLPIVLMERGRLS